MQPGAACSGKCSGGECSSSGAVWVLAACDGMAALYEKMPGGKLSLLPGSGNTVQLMSDVKGKLDKAFDNNEFNQLVLVGSPSDLSWAMLSLSEAVASRVVAEIKYPLIPAWFQRSAGNLKFAIENAMQPLI